MLFLFKIIERVIYFVNKPYFIVDRNIHRVSQGQYRESLFQRICNKEIKGKGGTQNELYNNANPKCHFVHHFMPFLKIGPFRLEVKLYIPFRTVIHDFFSKKEMDWMMDYSRPS